MTTEEARARLLSALEEIHTAGFDVWGWDDGTIQVYRTPSDGFEIPALRHQDKEDR